MENTLGNMQIQYKVRQTQGFKGEQEVIVPTGKAAGKGIAILPAVPAAI